MNRIEQAFSDLRAARRGAVIPFVTAAYPSLAVTEELLKALDAAGVRICEIGVPFSDPVADGPVIQASMTEALKTGVKPADIMAMVRRLRPTLKMALVAMISYSIVYRIGPERFIGEARDAGFDGFIFPDLPLDEAEGVGRLVRQAKMTCSLLIAPTTDEQREARIARACSGFVYLIARTGITGERDELPRGLAERVQRLRRVTTLPIAVGFGIGKPEHVAAVTAAADGAIVGSAVVKRLGQTIDMAPAQAAAHVAEFVSQLQQGAIRA
jgi:tryptophan synthase alpha chain